MKKTDLKTNKMGFISLNLIKASKCLTFLGMSHIKTILVLVLLAAQISQAQQKCEALFSNTQASAKIEVKDLNTLGKAMTEGMLLNESQADIFEVYRKVFFGDPNTSVNNKTLTDVTKILKSNLELQKPHFPEYTISTVEKVYETPEALSKYIKSQTQTAGQVRSNLFQIEANLGYWKKILDYKDQPMQEGLTKDQQKAFQQQTKKRFETYLNRIINKTNRELLADLKNDKIDYNRKGEALFKTLQYIQNWQNKKGKNTQFIRQAMVDLVHTVGFGNQSTQNLIKSKNGLDKIEGLKKLLDERDATAMNLGFNGHFQELQINLKIDFPTGLSKNEDPNKIIQTLEAEVQSQNYTTKPTDTVRVRSLSIQESPFRSCLGGSDCSTRTYFDKALDPNYNYFTMTNKDHQSTGHATVVLGEAGGMKVAFLDKLQNVPNQMTESFLTAVDKSLQDKGYRLAIPKDVGDHNGLSNMDTIRHFVQNEIVSRLTDTKTEFTPHDHQYKFENKYSRAYTKPTIKIFNAKQLDQNTEIKKGKEVKPYLAEATLDKNQLIQEVLKLKDSENPDDIMKFITSTGGIIQLGLYSKDQFLKDLEQISTNEKFDFKLRKQAVYHASGIRDDIAPITKMMEAMSEQQAEQLANEILSFKKSSNQQLKKLGDKFSEKFNLYYHDLPKNLYAVLLKNPDVDVNAKNEYGSTALHITVSRVRRDYGFKKIIELLIKQGADVNAKKNDGESVLHVAAAFSPKEIIELLIKQGANVNAKKNDGETTLHKAATYNRKEIVELLIKQDVKVNAKGKSGRSALHGAAGFGGKENVELLIKHGADVNAKDDSGSTALHEAASHNYKVSEFEIIVKSLIKHGADVNAKDDFGRSVLHKVLNDFDREDYGFKEKIDLLIKHGADVNAKDRDGRTALLEAAYHNHIVSDFEIIVESLIKRGADVNAKKNDGESVLHEVVDQHYRKDYGFKEKIDLLIKHGADVNKKNRDGRTALNLAVKYGSKEIVDLLHAHGATE